eukprot:9173821-Karenia_brevis.AAC.1
MRGYLFQLLCTTCAAGVHALALKGYDISARTPQLMCNYPQNTNPNAGFATKKLGMLILLGASSVAMSLC